MKFCKQVVFFFLVVTFFSVNLVAQNALQYWHGKERTIRYHPEGSDIVINLVRNVFLYDYLCKNIEFELIVNASFFGICCFIVVIEGRISISEILIFI
jgi:hypothetical protein